MTRSGRRMLLALDFGFLCILTASAMAGTVTSGPAADVAALQQRITQWTDGYNAADVTRLGDVFSEDFTFEQQGVPATPKDAVLKSYADLFSKYDTHIQVDTREIRVSGDMAFDRGSYVSTSTPKAGGKAAVQKGRFLEVWKRVGGVWQTQRFVNINDPAQ